MEAVVMVLSSELRFKARQAVDELVDGIGQELDRRSRLDQIEKSLFRGLLELGKSLLQDSVDEVADEEERAAPESLPGDRRAGEAGIALQRVERTPRRLVTVFGELHIRGPVYAVRRKQKIQRAPVDERLALPAGEFSYLFEDWAQRMVVKDAFAEAAASLHELLGIDVSVRSLEGMNRRMAADVEAFREQQPAPAAVDEGELLVVLSDATGVPMHRRGGKMQMAYLGASYTVDRFRRTVDQVLDEVLRKECAKSRPRPQHRRLYGDMTRALPDDPDTEFDGRVGVFSWLSHEVSTRSGAGSRPVICLMDGEHKLWARKRELLPDNVVEVLDLWHVMDRLWDVAKALHGADKTASRDFVSQRLRQILAGNVGRMIGGLRQTLTKRRVPKAAAETIASTITYFSNNRNRNRMRYDECLREGYPIASGVIEGACRHVVGDRLDRTGTRWTVDGAVAMLATRTTCLSDDWNDYQQFRIKREQTRLHQTAKT
jgi:hypothetical protein